jgi:hypothetical protein
MCLGAHASGNISDHAVDLGLRLRVGGFKLVAHRLRCHREQLEQKVRRDFGPGADADREPVVAIGALHQHCKAGFGELRPAVFHRAEDDLLIAPFDQDIGDALAQRASS